MCVGGGGLPQRGSDTDIKKNQQLYKVESDLFPPQSLVESTDERSRRVHNDGSLFVSH